MAFPVYVEPWQPLQWVDICRHGGAVLQILADMDRVMLLL